MISAFWKYFAETLRFGLIEKPGPLQALARGLALRFDTVREDLIFLRAQWFAQLCEPDLVPAFGKSRGLVRHHTESPEQFRARVVNAYGWHLLGGKQEGLPQILGFYGFDVAGIENLRKYQPSRWAEFQVGLINPAELADQNAILDGLETLVWLINEYKPARSVLARLYTDTYNVTPLVWSEGRWSEHFYSLFSGVPASDLGPGLTGRDNLILSFGLRLGVQAERLDGAFGVPIFAGLQRTGFIARYIDSPVWSDFHWSDDFPHRHSFTLGELFSTDWSQRTTTSYPWEGAWDDRKWAEFSEWDRLLPQWQIHNRGVSRSQLAYCDPCPEEEAPAPSFMGGRWGGLNANWSVPTAVQVDNPNRWGIFRYSDDTQRRVEVIHRQSAALRGLGGEVPVFATGGAARASGISGAGTAPLHKDAWNGTWDGRRWNDYIAYFHVTSISEEY